MHRRRVRPGPLLSYTLTATAARSATEAAGPALLLATTASGRAASAAALLVSALTAASAVTGPLVGAALDVARRPRRLFVAAILLLGVTFAVLGVVIADVPLPVAAGLAVLSGLGQPALTGGWTAQLPRLVPPALVPRGYALDGGTYNLGAIVGPAVGATALTFGPRVPLFAVTVIVLAALVTLGFVPLRGRPDDDPDDVTTRAPLARRLLGGLQALVVVRRLRANTVVTTVGLAGQAGIVVAAPGLSRDLTGGVHFTAALFVAFAIGGLVATLTLAVRPFARGHDDRGRATASGRSDVAVVAGTVAVAVGMTVVAASHAVPLTLAGAALTGAGDGVLMTGMFLVRAAEAPDGVRSQVFTAASSLRTSVYALTVAALAPFADERFRLAVAIGAALQVLALVLGAATGLVSPAATGRPVPDRA